jgi:uncharacterized membrane protein
MAPYTFLLLIHVISAILAVGANVTYAFWLRAAGRDRQQLLFAIGGVRRLDRTLANPGYVVLLVTGVLMVVTGPWTFETGWIAVSLVLYVATAILGIALFAPAIRRQLAEADRDPASEAYEAAARRSSFLGVLTVGIVLVIVTLMVTKPF